MKKIFFLSLILSDAAAYGQTPQPATPMPTPPVRTTPGTPAQPVAPAPNLRPNEAAPGFPQPFVGVVSNAPETTGAFPSNNFGSNPFLATNGFNGAGFNGTTTSPVLVDLGEVLGSVQGNIEQLLPTLFTLTTGGSVNTAGAAPGIPATGNPADRVAAQQFIGRVGTNTFVMDAGTLRLLLVLRTDLQHTLPVLQALSASGLPNAAGTSNSLPFNFANRFTAVTNSFSIAPLQPQPMTPTGR